MGMEQANLTGFDDNLAPPSWADEEIPLSAYSIEDEINEDYGFVYDLQPNEIHAPKKHYESLFEQITDNLNDQQKKAVTLEKNIGPVMVLAGAGTGKTAVLTRRIAHLVADGVSPRSIMAVTFTNKAANEMRERLKAFGIDPMPLVGTFHSVGLKIIKIQPDCAGVSKDFTVMDESDCKALWKSLFVVKKGEKTNPALYQINADDENLEIYRKQMFMYKEFGVRQSSDNFPDLNPHILAMLDIYEEARKKTNMVDFSDLISASLKALRGDGAGREWANRFTHLLVDEFQDTSSLQYNWCKALLNYSNATDRNMFCVGDDNQSIYSFRGAVVKNISHFVKSHNAIEIKLEQNYRCKKEILTLANRLIAQNPNGDKKRLWSQHDGANIECRAFIKEPEESYWITSHIKDHQDYQNSAILLRTRSAMVPVLTYMRQMGVPYQVVGAQDFFDRKEIKDAIALIRFAVNDHDHLSFVRSASLFDGVGKTTIDRIVKGAADNNLSILTICQNSSNEKVRNIGEIFSKVQAASDAAAGVTFLIEKAGLNSLYAEEKERLDSLKELVDIAKNAANLKQLMEQITLFSEKKEEKSGVTVSTIHAAKGLEWRNVYLPALCEGHMPSNREVDENDMKAFGSDEKKTIHDLYAEALQEERRLMYVALTRAKENIYASWSQSRMVFGSVSYFSASRFIEESGLDAYYTDDRKKNPNKKSNVKHEHYH